MISMQCRKRRNGRGWIRIELALAVTAMMVAWAGGTAEGENKPPGLDREFKVITKQLAESKRPSRLTQIAASQAYRQEALIAPGDRYPADVVLRRTAALLADLQARPDAPDLSAPAAKLEALRGDAAKLLVTDMAAQRELFEEAVALRRRIAFANPLLNFEKVLFATHHRSTRNHMCDQYFGFNARAGGGIYVLDDAFGDTPTARNIMAEAVVTNGRLKGKKLTGGSFMSLELSYDAKTILFAWTQVGVTKTQWAPESSFHIFKANVDGSNLVQLTDGTTNDFDPCFLPNGRIVFISERRGGFGRCHGRPVPVYTLHTMRDDGSDIITISYHESNEWHPSVDNDGMIVYSRWDYVDRDSNAAHHIWTTFPDGRDARSYHGNYPVLRQSRPWMELSIRAVPDSPLYMGVAAAHHGQNYGTLILIDHRLQDDRAMSQVRRATPEVFLPEAEGGGHDIYGQPWPLSEDYYLCVYDPGKRYGVYLVDAFGNREHLWSDPKVPCLDPIPLRPRLVPPVIANQTLQAVEDQRPGADTTATVAVMNVYDGEYTWPAGTTIKALRIVQVFPKATVKADWPRIGAAAQSLARGVLGTVPVEADGSAYFKAPPGVPLYFQALDAKGQAVQTMRSDTYLHPGEKLTCQGCHEPKRQQGERVGTMPTTIRRAPSTITPDVDGSYPLLYPRLVQGVLDRNCVPCHKKESKAPGLGGEITKTAGWSQSFVTLHRLGWAKHGGNGGIGRNGGSVSVPGKIGAKASALLAMLDKGHHKVKLSPKDLYRITLWLDCNTNFYGDYFETEKQARGEVVMPRVE